MPRPIRALPPSQRHTESRARGTPATRPRSHTNGHPSRAPEAEQPLDDRADGLLNLQAADPPPPTPMAPSNACAQGAWTPTPANNARTATRQVTERACGPGRGVAEKRRTLMRPTRSTPQRSRLNAQRGFPPRRRSRVVHNALSFALTLGAILARYPLQRCSRAVAEGLAATRERTIRARALLGEERSQSPLRPRGSVAPAALRCAAPDPLFGSRASPHFVVHPAPRLFAAEGSG